MFIQNSIEILYKSFSKKSLIDIYIIIIKQLNSLYNG